MNNKINQQLQMEVYVEHGVAKLRYKPKPKKDLFSVEAQEGDHNSQAKGKEFSRASLRKQPGSSSTIK